MLRTMTALSYMFVQQHNYIGYSHGQAKSTNKNKVFQRCPKTIGIDYK